MSNESKIKSMPYRIAEGEIELMKIRSSAAIVRAAATRERRRALRWGCVNCYGNECVAAVCGS